MIIGNLLSDAHRLIIQPDNVGSKKTVAVIQPPHLLNARIGDFCRIVRHLHHRMPHAIGRLVRRELIHAGKRGLFPAGYQMSANAPCINRRPVQNQRFDDLFV